MTEAAENGPFVEGGKDVVQPVGDKNLRHVESDVLVSSMVRKKAHEVCFEPYVRGTFFLSVTTVRKPPCKSTSSTERLLMCLHDMNPPQCVNASQLRYNIGDLNPCTLLFGQSALPTQLPVTSSCNRVLELCHR